jgi:AmmeMemoRadiSam system protein A
MTGDLLLGLARASIAERFGGPTVQRPADSAWLEQPGAVFVTLTLEGELRGCVGSASARRPLFDDVMDNAKAAAFEDPRFKPLTADELTRSRIEVSVLSPLEKLEVETEAELLKQLRPGVDGVQIAWGAHRALFIPEMWNQISDPGTFLFYLKRKAGLPGDGWREGTRVHRFTAEAFTEPE